MSAEFKARMVETITGFNWGNYGLDDLECLESDDWPQALADELMKLQPEFGVVTE